jgi:sugar phosphate isomerase/epimerase
MKIVLCNEVLHEMEFAAQCDYAAALGYDGLEIAPFTLGDLPHFLSAGERTRIRRDAADAGIQITGLHYLLLTPPGLSINSPDPSVRERTVEVIRRLIGLCADLGGHILVHGSPAQRQVPDADDLVAAWGRARGVFAEIAKDAESAQVTYCIEPLPRQQTNFINTVAEAAQLVRAICSPAVKTMIDAGSAATAEGLPLPAVLDRWMPTGLIAHIHVNDPNRRGPGQGGIPFAPFFATLERHRYEGMVAVEPFDYVPSGPGCAARAIGYIRGILEALPRGA